MVYIPCHSNRTCSYNNRSKPIAQIWYKIKLYTNYWLKYLTYLYLNYYYIRPSGRSYWYILYIKTISLMKSNAIAFDYTCSNDNKCTQDWLHLIIIHGVMIILILLCINRVLYKPTIISILNIHVIYMKETCYVVKNIQINRI